MCVSVCGGSDCDSERFGHVWVCQCDVSVSERMSVETPHRLVGRVYVCARARASVCGVWHTKLKMTF